MKKDLKNAMICGVCAGIEKEFNIDVCIVRSAFALLTFLGFGFPVVVYIILAIVLPKESDNA